MKTSSIITITKHFLECIVEYDSNGVCQGYEKNKSIQILNTLIMLETGVVDGIGAGSYKLVAISWKWCLQREYPDCNVLNVCKFAIHCLVNGITL